MHEVTINPIDPERVGRILNPQIWKRFLGRAAAARRLLSGRTIWNINSTAVGGGVAEMLQPLVAHARGQDIDARWIVMEGNPDFFAVTKRIHNNIHDHAGDGGELGEHEHAVYRSATKANAEWLAERVRKGDIVICHDPQTAGLVAPARRAGAIVIWRSHIGNDHATTLSARAWRFLEPYLTEAHAYVFSRKQYIPEAWEKSHVWVIRPSIDPFSPKNQPLDPDTVNAILVKTGVIEGPPSGAAPMFMREDGTQALVERCADMIHLGRPPTADRRLVVQVSRWDHLKDPVGVMQGFARYLAHDSASLVLAGPNVTAVADDPEGAQVLDEVEAAWRELDHEERKHIHIACLPMSDREENAAIVNALQRHATVVVQKSLYEGFGLTVTEAMWKARPVVASAVGGIQDQIEHGSDGLLLDDPKDLDGFAKHVQRVLGDDSFAWRLGERARDRVEHEFLFSRHLIQYLELFETLLA